MNERIPKTLSVADFLVLNGPGVYAWKRGDDYLYVGCCRNFLSRFCRHQIIARVEPVLESDEILIWPIDDRNTGFAFERFLIGTHKPKYNKGLVRTITKQRRSVLSFLTRSELGIETDAKLFVERLRFDEQLDDLSRDNLVRMEA